MRGTLTETEVERRGGVQAHRRVGSLKLLQDLHKKNKSSQTRLRFVVCLVLAKPPTNQRPREGVLPSVWKCCASCERFEKNGGEGTIKKRPTLVWNTETAIRTG